jgi:hypothetical protein
LDKLFNLYFEFTSGEKAEYSALKITAEGTIRHWASDKPERARIFRCASRTNQDTSRGRLLEGLAHPRSVLNLLERMGMGSPFFGESEWLFPAESRNTEPGASYSLEMILLLQVDFTICSWKLQGFVLYLVVRRLFTILAENNISVTGWFLLPVVENC